ncbi:MAG: DUF4440 domain-containing protein [Gemmatimonadetes bacterium]|nr:ester cyclase [Gemmatimonadota bacterium]NIR79292.1 ester cyclase [Gemmatimonadota bacterium]NIT87949.1 ester cyclase [Gemmatimonadota bacterium]NIU31800.1 ester cyclase [Gemmatimonadota bacterium]NIU36415.1 DUF4440 domain-containing protein [Gemmatimonadota bacterium]
MSELDRAILVRRLYESGFDPERLDEFVAEDCVYRGPGGEVRGREALREMCAELRRAFPDLRIRVDALRVDGDEVEVEWTMTGTHGGAIGEFEATGREVEMSGRHTEVVRGGRVVERWGTSDHVGLARRLREAAENEEEEEE